MTMTRGRIERAGRVVFHDADLHVWEEGLMDARNAGGWKSEKQWERQFKRDVFARIIQCLRRLGWTVGPWADAEHYKVIAHAHRTCRKGDLQGELAMCGRHIEFEMWQDVQNGDNPNGGKYDFNKEDRMTYLQRLEMERTRRRIRNYLCNVFTGYEFQPPKVKSPNPDPLAYFNDRWDGEHEKRRSIHRFQRGEDGWPSEREINSWDRKDGDGTLLNHGDVRWLRDRNGRAIRGRVYGGINGMWLFVYGPGERDHTHEPAGRFFTYRTGETPRKLFDLRARRNRIERDLAIAVKEMRFERAAKLRDALLRIAPTDSARVTAAA
ncbi:UvrB/UvrC motif-containing protein [Burkholderia anthina]|uniref:UvrB/UvrC motif-containing protein n=1 Tax=Burkholderia anthina TaxID=179879 RepID=UPI00158EB9C5|nr:UvrB/UvrC motif-containing protein [Burkholderia anthina]